MPYAIYLWRFQEDMSATPDPKPDSIKRKIKLGDRMSESKYLSD